MSLPGQEDSSGLRQHVFYKNHPRGLQDVCNSTRLNNHITLAESLQREVPRLMPERSELDCILKVSFE